MLTFQPVLQALQSSPRESREDSVSADARYDTRRDKYR